METIKAEKTAKKNNPIKEKIIFLQKKNKARKTIFSKGVIKKEGFNSFSNYSYVTESQYKSIFNEVLSTHDLEFSFNCKNHEIYDHEVKNSTLRGVFVEAEATLSDVTTGYSETSTVYGDAQDSGDKALYKALTGALKYYIANTFLVESGDDAEKDTLEIKKSPKQPQKILYGDKQCPVCGQIHNGQYPKCFECYKKGLSAPKVTAQKTKTLFNPEIEEEPFPSKSRKDSLEDLAIQYGATKRDNLI